MQNRFTFKDFVVIGLLIVAVLLVVGTIVQSDRTMEHVQVLGRKMSDLERRLQELATAPPAAMQRSAGEGGAPLASAPTGASAGGKPPVAPVASQAASGAGGPVTTVASAGTAGSRDESWARPGVKIEWQPPAGFPTDPRTVPGFREGGEFIEVFEAQPRKIVPYLYADVYGLRVLDRVCESLASFDPFTMKLTGVLADAWQRDPDGLWIRAHLNPRATFSDGTPVTAEDVRWTFKDYVLNTSIDADRARSTIADALADVQVVDERTVDFIFKKALFTNTLIAFGNPILPKHYFSQFEPGQINQATGLLMGSGPFRLEKLPTGATDLGNQWAPPADIVLVRNERWWKGRAPLAMYRFKVITDELARLVDYRNGLSSQIIPSAPQFNKVLNEDRDFEESNYALKWVNMRSGYSFIAWQAGPRGETGRTPPFHDKRVRQAMTLLLDREKMIRDIWDGVGMVAKGPFNPESPASNPAVEPMPFDPAQARKLLKEAGWEDRDGDGILEDAKGEKFRFEFTYATGGEISERIARYIKDTYSKAGMVCETRPVDWSAYQSILKARDFDAFTMSWAASAPESDLRQMFHSESTAKGMDNWIQWKSPEADRLIDKGRTTMDDETRMLVWQELEKVIADEQPYTFVRLPPWLRFVRRDVGNVNTYRTGLVPDEFFKSETVMSPTN